MSCFPNGPVRPSEPEILGPDGRSLRENTLRISISAYEALTHSCRGMFRQGPLIVLTDVPLTEPSLAWQYAHGRLSETSRFDWLTQC